MASEDDRRGVSEEQAFFNLVFREWFVMRTWRKAVALLTVPYFLFGSIVFVLSLLTNKKLVLFRLPSTTGAGTNANSIIYWPLFPENPIIFLVFLSSLLALSIFCARKAIECYPIDPRHPYSSMVHYQRAGTTQDAHGYDYSQGDDKKNAFFGLTGMFLHHVGFILIVSVLTNTILSEMFEADVVVGLILLMCILDLPLVSSVFEGLVGGVPSFIPIICFGGVFHAVIYGVFNFENEDEWKQVMLLKMLLFLTKKKHISDDEAKDYLMRKYRRVVIPSDTILADFGFKSLNDLLDNEHDFKELLKQL